MISHNWFFDYGFKFQDSACNGCHNLTFFCRILSDIAVITVKNVNWRCIINDIDKSEAINLLENSVLKIVAIYKNVYPRNQY